MKLPASINRATPILSAGVFRQALADVMRMFDAVLILRCNAETSSRRACGLSEWCTRRFLAEDASNANGPRAQKPSRNCTGCRVVYRQASACGRILHEERCRFGVLGLCGRVYGMRWLYTTPHFVRFVALLCAQPLGLQTPHFQGVIQRNGKAQASLPLRFPVSALRARHQVKSA